MTRSDRHATIIAFYGDDKSTDLKKFILEIQRAVQQFCGNAFMPRPLGDIHATLIGIESVAPLTPRNEFDELRASRFGNVDVVGLCEFLRQEIDSTCVRIQFGGFQDCDYPVSSRGARLFDRGFTINGDKVVLIGWPVDESCLPTDLLDRLRRGASNFGARHRYYQSPDDRDPDAYMVIGELTEDYPRAAEVVDMMRAAVARSACKLRISAQDIRVAAYESPRLPAGSTSTEALSDFLS